MMMTVRKWRVLIKFQEPRPSVVLWVSDNYAANVLRKVADLDFSANGIEQPIGIMIGEELGATT